MPLILVIIVIILILAVVPIWPHSRRWGYYPGGGLGLVLLIILLLWLLGII